MFLGSVVDKGLYTPTEIQRVSNSMTLNTVPISFALLGVEVLVACWLKADSHIACRSHAAPMPFPRHAVARSV